ncbi:MAG: FAD-dependent oxidoreductase [Thermoplasmata archaeon]
MTESSPTEDYDVLVVGAGVGGMESALTLGDMGFRVLLVEKESSVGGRMILLSKVFPTLDCASCISTPKMAAVVNHPNVRTLVSSQVDRITREDGRGFTVRLTQNPTFIDPAKCTGCALCETACTVTLPDEFNYDLSPRRAAHIAFPQAVPKKAVITRRGTSPCSFTCPAGVEPHGYVSLVRAGLYDEAFRQHLEDAPLPGALSRACYAPCEERCSCGDLEGPLPIRGIKRFLVDRYYASHPEPVPGPSPTRTGQKVAIIGSGPAGLTAAYFLAKAGHAVTVFEAEPKAGGMLRWGIPSYRLPEVVLDRDIKNITSLGVDIRTGVRVQSLAKLRSDGYAATFLAAGTVGGRRLSVPGDDLGGIHDSLEFLRRIKDGSPPDLSGKHVVIVGGGNVALDCARSARRLKPREVHLVYRRSREEMPAHPWEVQDAEDEGVRFHFSWAIDRLRGVDGKVSALELVGSASEGGKGRDQKLVRDENQRLTLRADVAVSAIGLIPATSPFSTEVVCKSSGAVEVARETLQTSLPFVFAGGDDVLGPSSIAEAMGQGRRAAFFIDRYLHGLPLEGATFDDPLPMVDRSLVVRENVGRGSLHHVVPPNQRPLEERIASFEEYELTMSEAEARTSAARCLDCGFCSECRQCVSACPADAIHLDMRAQQETVSVRAVALATGFHLFDARNKPTLGFGRFPNVVTATQMERILAPTRPYNAVVRPSDGRVPSNVAFVLCVGSRDEQVGNRLCSRVCCMYSIKQAQLLMGALLYSDVTIYYIDIRAYGKGYEEFYQGTKAMGVHFVKGRVARIEETEGSDLLVHYEDIEGDGGHKVARHDLVVLSVGLLPNLEALTLFPNEELAQDAHAYIRERDEDLEPGETSLPGVFAVGSPTAVRDIPDTIVHAEAASAQIASYLQTKENAA